MTAGRPLVPLPVGTGAAALDALGPLAAALADTACDGTGPGGAAPALLPVPTGAADPTGSAATRLLTTLGGPQPVPADVALVVATSGTTGPPKGAQLTAAALRASATATHARLGGPGVWLLALPAHHIAGLQVLVRSLLAGTEPVVLDVTSGFRPAALVDATARLPAGRRYTSLVPTQLHKLLAEGSAEAVSALATFDAVLVGGAACPARLVARARAAGIAVVRTYGSSETAGGCVYDGRPLDGVRVRIDPDGRVRIGGPTLASGYRGLPSHPAWERPGWFRTDDAGRIDQDGVLRVLGRIDEGILTGGLTVLPQVVEAALLTDPTVAACAVFGVPDVRLGRRVVAAVVPHRSPACPAPTPSPAWARAVLVAAGLDPTAAPREVHVVQELPLRGPGKVDRAALRARYATAPPSDGMIGG